MPPLLAQSVILHIRPATIHDPKNTVVINRHLILFLILYKDPPINNNPVDKAKRYGCCMVPQTIRLL